MPSPTASASIQFPVVVPGTLLAAYVRDHARLGNDLTAYELLNHAKIYGELAAKHARLVRRHRQQVFDEKSGEAHTRAILRLKHKTITGKAIRFANEARHQRIAGDRLASMGY